MQPITTASQLTITTAPAAENISASGTPESALFADLLAEQLAPLPLQQAAMLPDALAEIKETQVGKEESLPQTIAMPAAELQTLIASLLPAAGQQSPQAKGTEKKTLRQPEATMASTVPATATNIQRRPESDSTGITPAAALPTLLRAEPGYQNLELPEAPLQVNTQNLLQASTNPGQNANTHHVAARFGTSAWEPAFTQQISWMAKAESQSASLSLNPPELGPLKVELRITNDQTIASFSSAIPEVRQAIEAALPKLRDMLGEAGLQLSEANIQSGGQEQHEQQQNSPGKPKPTKEITDQASQLSQSENISLTKSGTGIINIFA